MADPSSQSVQPHACADPKTTEFVPVQLSLLDLAGLEYAQAVCRAFSWLTGAGQEEIAEWLARPVEFFPHSMHQRLADLLPSVGAAAVEPLYSSSPGATTGRWAAATQTRMAPLAGWGYYRIGEDGRLYLLTKAEHYHASLGHGFPGYELVEVARSCGIPNATHNNTRGHITRLLERELIAAANDPAITSSPPLSRVINLETGSIAAEAALKMCLARFYQVQSDAPPPKYAGRVPVLIVLGDEEGAVSANYHGTTILAQAMRGMWSQLAQAMNRGGLLRVAPVRPNDLQGLRAAFERHDRGQDKVAGFFHELVMMNHGARTLSRHFVQEAYRLCAEHDVPTVTDEIQTGVWSPQLFLFREYGVRPSLVALGKGFPGGEYPASRLLSTADLDVLPQFGALVTNGQEELASLAYLVTMRWVQANAEPIRAIGDHYEARLRDLADRYPTLLAGFDGVRHLAALHFHDLKKAKAFTSALNERGLDISVQTYKTSCPPAALTKLPLIMGIEAVDHVVDRMNAALATLA